MEEILSLARAHFAVTISPVAAALPKTAFVAPNGGPADTDATNEN